MHKYIIPHKHFIQPSHLAVPQFSRFEKRHELGEGEQRELKLNLVDRNDSERAILCLPETQDFFFFLVLPLYHPNNKLYGMSNSLIYQFH